MRVEAHDVVKVFYSKLQLCVLAVLVMTAAASVLIWRGAEVSSTNSDMPGHAQRRMPEFVEIDKCLSGDIADLAVGRSWAEQLEALMFTARDNAPAALAEVAAMAGKEERKAAATAVCRAIAEKDPELATKAAWELGLGRFADEEAEVATLEFVARCWAEHDLVQVLEWTKTLPLDEESRRDYILKGIVAAVAAESPSLAARIASEPHFPEGPVMAGACEQVAELWAGQDYSAALVWVASLRNSIVRERGIEGLVNAEMNRPRSFESGE